jgi:hypothetical protein
MAEPAIADNEQFTFARDKTFAMAQVVNSLLDSTPAVLSSVHALNQLNNHVQAFLNAYASDKNPGHITNACARFEKNVLSLLWGFAPQIQTSKSTGLPELFERMSQSSSETIRQSAAERDKLTERVRETMAVAKLEPAFAEKEMERAAAFEATLVKIRSDYSTIEEGTKGSSAALIAALEDQRSKATQDRSGCWKHWRHRHVRD